MRSPLPLVTLLYLLFAIRRLYGEPWGTALIKAVVLRVGLFAAEFVVIGISLVTAFELSHDTGTRQRSSASEPSAHREGRP